MSDLLANLWMGFGVAANPYNIMFCLLGALVGTWSGSCPASARSPPSRCCCRSPGLPPVGALIMLAGTGYGAQYGGLTN